MLISELQAQLEKIKQEHGDLPVLLTDRYAHYRIKYINFSNACDGDHVCVRMYDNLNSREFKC